MKVKSRKLKSRKMSYLIVVIAIILGATLVFLMLKVKEVEATLLSKLFEEKEKKKELELEEERIKKENERERERIKKENDEELRLIDEEELNIRIDLYHSSAFPNEGTKNHIKDGLLFLINDYAEEYGEEYGKKLRDKLFNESPHKELLKDIDLKAN